MPAAGIANIHVATGINRRSIVVKQGVGTVDSGCDIKQSYSDQEYDFFILSLSNSRVVQFGLPGKKVHTLHTHTAR